MPADPTVQTLNYEAQGGSEWVVGGTLTILGGATVTGLGAYTIQPAIPDLTDSSGGAAADGTIGAVTAPTALTNSTGGTADNTLAAVGATDTGDRSGAINDNFTELATAQAANRLAIVALTDAAAELADKVNDILASLRTGGALET